MGMAVLEGDYAKVNIPSDGEVSLPSYLNNEGKIDEYAVLHYNGVDKKILLDNLKDDVKYVLTWEENGNSVTTDRYIIVRRFANDVSEKGIEYCRSKGIEPLWGWGYAFICVGGGVPRGEFLVSIVCGCDKCHNKAVYKEKEFDGHCWRRVRVVDF